MEYYYLSHFILIHCNQDIEMNSVGEISVNENRDEWRRNWKECLRRICDHHNDEYFHHMLEMNVERGNVRGVLKRGDEVIEVRNENENEVELMIVNVRRWKVVTIIR